MINVKKIRNNYGDYLCRRSINSAYHVHLKQTECVYGPIITCPICNERHHSVVGFKKIGKLKMLFA